MKRTADAETAPLRDPEYYQYDLDLAEVAEVWRRGSVDRVVAARPHRRTRCASRPTLGDFEGRVSDSGEGRWTVHRRDRRGRARAGAQRRRCSSASRSRGEADFADKLLSAMRKEFGGHDEKTSDATT